MSRFVQIHLLTSYPPSNLNRDDLGRPKTAVMGGSTRLRISSQSLKRAWRVSEIFQQSVRKENIGTRTKTMGVEIYNKLLEKGIDEGQAREWGRIIAGKFGKLKSGNTNRPLDALKIEQLAHFTPQETKRIFDLVDRLAEIQASPTDQDLNLLQKDHTAADIALFGRMLADATAYNVEAAAQVAHAITVHKVAVEDDYFTAVDDLNLGEEDMGAAHVDSSEFAAGLFYLYICIDTNSLLKNLADNTDLAGKAVAGLVEAAAKVSPTGKQNSFASRAYASFLLAENGDQQPRSLSVAFLKPITADDLLAESVKQLNATRDRIDKVYGPCAADCRSMNALTGEGSLAEIIKFVLE